MSTLSCGSIPDRETLQPKIMFPINPLCQQCEVGKCGCIVVNTRTRKYINNKKKTEPESFVPEVCSVLQKYEERQSRRSRQLKDSNPEHKTNIATETITTQTESKNSIGVISETNVVTTVLNTTSSSQINLLEPESISYENLVHIHSVDELIDSSSDLDISETTVKTITDGNVVPLSFLSPNTQEGSISNHVDNVLTSQSNTNGGGANSIARDPRTDFCNERYQGTNYNFESLTQPYATDNQLPGTSNHFRRSSLNRACMQSGTLRTSTADRFCCLGENNTLKTKHRNRSSAQSGSLRTSTFVPIGSIGEDSSLKGKDRYKSTMQSGALRAPATDPIGFIDEDTSLGSEKTQTSDEAPPRPAPISINHYERLVEELKCPGCATPMQPPIKLCISGHSVCSACTETLTRCPLCKANFTKLRSRTLEALCSKAHFRCSNASAGCTVRLPRDLLCWHEKQCVWKTLKCFMGRVWGDCRWTGLELEWKDHVDNYHFDKVFRTNEVSLVWNLKYQNEPLAGYYIFEAFGEMFNFYEVYDKDRILFTMTITSPIVDRKNNFAYEVEMFRQDNDALVLTQRFPVHSEYDKDILLDGTCVCTSLSDITRLLNHDKDLHFCVRIQEVKSPRRKSLTQNHPLKVIPINYQLTTIEGSNLKSVPANRILTRDLKTTPKRPSHRLYGDSSSDEDFHFDGSGNKKWTSPQLHFDRKFLPNSMCQKGSMSTSESSPTFPPSDNNCNNSTCKYPRENVTTSLRRSFRSLKTDIIELKKPFVKKNPEKKESLIKE